MVLHQLQQAEMKDRSTQLLHLPSFHLPRNLPDNRAEGYGRVTVAPWMQSAGVQCRLTAAEATWAYPQLGKHLL